MDRIFGQNFFKRKTEENTDRWSFRKIDAIEDALFNNTLERFYDLGISGLVRENIQNSLDGKLQSSDKPVQVIISTGDIPATIIPGIDEIRSHILSLRGQNSYTRETINHMQSCLDMQNVPYISFEDRNTKGLKGAEHGEDIQEGDTWGVYAYKKGVHHTESDEELESTRGGSHGVGKIASNAASELHLMFFANCDASDRQHIGGTAELIEHELNGQKYRATGYFTKLNGDKYYPYENNFGPVFEKKTRGLKIIVPYVREQFQGQENIIRAVCDNFFIAIINKKLEVLVNDEVIDSESILQIVQNPDIYVEQDYEDIKTNFTPLYVKTYLESDPMDIVISDKMGGNYPFSLYFTYDERIKKGRTAIVRGIGMKIEDKKIYSYVNASFNAVMIPKTSDGDVFLKTLENESHTSLASEHIKNPQLRGNAKRFIYNIDREMKKIIADYIAKANPSDGQIDTSELIYSVERNFKKDLSKQVATVEINKDRKNGKKKVVKIKRTKPEKEEKEEKEKKPRKPRKPKIDKETNKERYQVQTEAVKRLVLKDKEVVAFDFNGEEQYSGETVCDISLVVVDGMGNADESRFNVDENYGEVVDKKANSRCSIVGDTVKDVTINDGKACLEMKTTDRFNDSLKFIYYVEV